MRKPTAMHVRVYPALTPITLEITEEKKKKKAQKVSNILIVGYLYSFRERLKGNYQQPPVQINDTAEETSINCPCSAVKS